MNTNNDEYYFRFAYYQQVFTRMKGEGCDAVILGRAEIPLIMNGSYSLPTLDSTRLIARAALNRAVHGDGK
jgi:aspartate racemase